MHASIAQLLRVQEVDSEVFLLRESLRQRPREVEDERRKLLECRKALEEIVGRMKDLRMESDRRELDVKRSDAEIEKFNIALNQARTNEEYTILREQIRRQVELRGKAEEEVLEKLTQLDQLEVERQGVEARFRDEEKAVERKTRDVEAIVEGIRQQLAALEARRAELAAEIDRDHLKIYERVLAHHQSLALARIADQVCQGCYITVTAQDVNLVLQEQFVQCRNCSRILYLP